MMCFLSLFGIDGGLKILGSVWIRIRNTGEENDMCVEWAEPGPPMFHVFDEIFQKF